LRADGAGSGWGRQPVDLPAQRLQGAIALLQLLARLVLLLAQGIDALLELEVASPLALHGLPCAVDGNRQSGTAGHGRRRFDWLAGRRTRNHARQRQQDADGRAVHR
jgi:hypothetical protein